MLGIISKKKLKKDIELLKKENNLQDFKMKHLTTSQYWQGYEDGNDNVLNFISGKYLK